jgi:hypothetical protein
MKKALVKKIRILMANVTLTNEISFYDKQGAILYIVGVLIWYAIGFGLILIDDINPRRGQEVKKQKHTNVYQTVYNLHEQKTRNDILIELKDKDKRKQLWEIYYGTKQNPPLTIEKDKQTVDSIIKQLTELNERRRLLQNTLYDISLDQSDVDETESNHSIQ